MEIVNITKRFIEIVNSLDNQGVIKSKSQLAVALDTHKQSLNEILKGKRNVTLEVASRICEMFHVNPSFLLMGDMPKFIKRDEGVRKTNISYVPVRVQAGYGDQINNPIFEADLEKFTIPGPHFHDDEYRCFEVEGDSMFPSYHHGDRVICSPIPAIYLTQALRDYMIYVVVTEHSLLLKRVVNKIKSHKAIELISDNVMYEPKLLPAEEIKEIWKVEGLITNRSFAYKKENDN
ncbi:MAG: LexA family transcriptional regulator [Saprospiraceae bacterium]|nr:LexA family transcriptional regulator [Saprospiraceae bacterium]